MNKLPPNQDEPEDVDDHYRRVSALDPSRPSESVRRAVLGYAAQLAAERAAKKDSPRRAARQTWRRPAIFGTLAAAGLAGVLIAPHFLPSRVSPLTANSPVPVSRPGAGATPMARARAAAPSPDVTADRQPPAPMPQAQSAIEHRVAAARNAAPKPIEAYTRPNEDRPAVDTPAVSAAQNAAAASGAEAMAPRAPRVNSAVSAMPASPAAAAPMLRAGHLTDSAAALRRAAEMGDIPGLQAALDQPVDIDARDADGRTALMLAVSHGRIAAVNALLAHGADPNATDARGTTPLQAAVAGDQGAIVAALNRAGAR